MAGLSPKVIGPGRRPSYLQYGGSTGPAGASYSRGFRPSSWSSYLNGNSVVPNMARQANVNRQLNLGLKGEIPYKYKSMGAPKMYGSGFNAGSARLGNSPFQTAQYLGERSQWLKKAEVKATAGAVGAGKGLVSRFNSLSKGVRYGMAGGVIAAAVGASYLGYRAMTSDRRR